MLAALLERDRTGEGSDRRRLALRDRARLHRLPPRRLPRRRHGAARPGHALPDGRAVPGVPDRGRRADDRRRQRPAVRGDLRRRRAAGARRRPALPHEPRPRASTATSSARSSRSALSRGTTPRTGSERLTDAGVPAAPVADVADVVAAPQTEALGMLQPLAPPDDPRPQAHGAPAVASTASGRSTAPPRPPSASTPRRSCAKPATTTTTIAALAARRSDPSMSHLSASFSATIRVRLADAPGSFAAARQGDRRRRRLARRDRPRPRREGRRRSATSRSRRPTPTTSRGSSRASARSTASRSSTSPTGRSSCTSAARSRCGSKVPRQDPRRPLDGVHAGRRARSAWRSPTIRDSAWNLTIKQNTVAVVSDGTAVLGLGDIGPEAAMPVMEGKALLFKEFGGVDAFPLCLDTKDVDEIVAIVQGDRAAASAASTSRTSRRRAASRSSGACAQSSTSPSSTTTSTARRSSSLAALAERAQGRRQADRGRRRS